MGVIGWLFKGLVNRKNMNTSTNLNTNIIKRIHGSFSVFAVYMAALLTYVGTLVYLVLWSEGNAVLADYNLNFNIFLCVLGLLFAHIGLFARFVLRWRLPLYVHIFIHGMLVAHLVLGSIFRFYDSIFLWDSVMHFLAGSFFLMVGYSIALMLLNAHSNRILEGRRFALHFGIYFSMFIAVAWEVFEFLIDFAFGFNMMRWQDEPSTDTFMGSGLIDTMVDIILHFGGVVLGVLIGWLWFRKYPSDTGILIVRYRDLPAIEAARLEE